MTFFDNKVLKIVLSILFGGLVMGLYLFLATHSTYTYRGLYYACIVLSFIFAFIFVRRNSKQISLTAALLFACCADYFLILNFVVSRSTTDQVFGMLAFCGLQICFAIYTWFLIKSLQWRIGMVIIRAAVSCLVAIILPLLHLGLLEILSVVYFFNFFITIIIVACHAKSEWLTLVGMISFFICDIIIGLTNGGGAILGINTVWLASGDYAFFFYVPGIFLIALSSVWANKKSGLTPLR